MSRFRLPLGVVAALLVLTFVTGASAARPLVKHLDVTVLLSEKFKCGPQVEVFVVAETRGVFYGDRKKLQRALGGARATLGFECANVRVEDIRINGVVDRSLVYRGIFSKQNNWVLVDVPLSTAESKPSPPRPKNAASPPKVLPPKRAQAPVFEPNFDTALSEPPMFVFLP